MNLEESNYKQICNIKDELTDIRNNVLGNFNKRLIDNEELVRGVDTRTKIFSPKHSRCK